MLCDQPGLPARRRPAGWLSRPQVRRRARLADDLERLVRPDDPHRGLRTRPDRRFIVMKCGYRSALQPRIDVVLVGVDEGVPDDGGLDDRLDRLLLDIGQHPQHHLPTTLDQAQDRWLVLFQRAAARRSGQSAPPREAPIFATAAGWPLCPAT